MFSPQSESALRFPREDEICTELRELIGNLFATFSALVWLHSIPDRSVLLVWERISVLCCGPVGAPRKFELRTRNETNVEIFMRVREKAGAKETEIKME